MHFSNLILTTALTLAPAVYSYGVATVEISYHKSCANGIFPTRPGSSTESTVVATDTCTQLPAKHSRDIDAYAFQVTPITKDTTSICHAVGVYTNDKCIGLPTTVIPLFPGQGKAVSPCIHDGYFQKSVSVRLICEDRNGRGQGHEHEHEHGEQGPKKQDSKDGEKGRRE